VCNSYEARYRVFGAFFHQKTLLLIDQLLLYYFFGWKNLIMDVFNMNIDILLTCNESIVVEGENDNMGLAGLVFKSGSIVELVVIHSSIVTTNISETKFIEKSFDVCRNFFFVPVMLLLFFFGRGGGNNLCCNHNLQ
jgi:hypothetical protein